MQYLSTVAVRLLGTCRVAFNTPASRNGKPLHVTSSQFPSSCPPAPRERAPLWLLRKEMALVVADCSELIRDKMTLAIYRADDGLDLWLLRSELFQYVAQARGQLEARRRINELLPFFAEWVPKRQLAAI